jgi:hypothetical protein
MLAKPLPALEDLKEYLKVSDTSPKRTLMNVLVSLAITLAVFLPGAVSSHHGEATTHQMVDNSCHHH